MTISVQFNTHAKIMLFKTLGALMFVIQYLFLGAYTGMILDFIGIIRNFIFADNVKKGKNNKPWVIGFTIFTVVVGIVTIILTFNDLVLKMDRITSNYIVMIILAVTMSVFSIIAKALTTIAYGLKDAHKLRCINFPASALWFIHNLTYFSISGVINEIFVMGSIIVAEVRFKKKKTPTEPDTPPQEERENEKELG
jgi:hypothetical protein